MKQVKNPQIGSRSLTIDKDRLAKLRKRIGDTGEDYPEVEAIIREFWDYDDDDRAKAVAISRQYLLSREQARKK